MSKKKYYLVVAICAVFIVIGFLDLINIKTNKKSVATEESEVTMQERDESKESAFSFTLKDLSGNEVSLKDYRGKNIILNFWASWCEPCKEEMQDLERFKNDIKNDDIEILCINVGEDKETVANYINENGINLNVLLDENSEVAFGYRITTLPATYVIDKNGDIDGMFRGQINYDTMMGIKTVLEGN